MNEFRISASNLGLFQLQDYCERCAWIMLKMSHRFAFQRPFPGILQYLDHLQKAAVHRYFDQYGKPPKWFGDFSDAKGYIETGKLVYVDSESGIELRGAPDEVVVLPDGSLAVIDYKTARHREGKDVLLPKYQAQVNAYAYLLAHHEEAYKVSKGGLLYFQIRTEYAVDELLDLVTKDGLDAHFYGVPMVLDIDPENVVPPLLVKTRKLLSRRTPPKGREGCKDCELLARMANLAQIGESAEKMKKDYGLREAERMWAAMDQYWKDRGPEEEEACFDPEGIIGLWDFSNRK